MSTERLDDVYIRQPAPDAADALLSLRPPASLIVGIVVANTALLAVLGIGIDLVPSSAADSGDSGVFGSAIVAVLAYPFFLMLCGAASIAAWHVVRRDLPCVVAIVGGLAWLGFGA
jgi:hypothetical protein